MESVLKKLQQLAITIKDHAKVENLESWLNQVKQLNPTAVPTKTLILKLKGSEDLLMIVGLESTKYSVTTVSKALGFKDARIANDDLVLSKFGVGKVDANIFQLPLKDKVILVLGKDFVESKQELGFRAFSNEKSMFVRYEQIKQHLETSGQEFKVVDLANPASAVAKPEAVVQTKEKEVMVGLTVTKEENFPKWYEQILVIVINRPRPKCWIIMMFLVVTLLDQVHSQFGKRFKNSWEYTWKIWELKIVISQCSLLLRN